MLIRPLQASEGQEAKSERRRSERAEERRAEWVSELTQASRRMMFSACIHNMTCFENNRGTLKEKLGERERAPHL